MWVDQLPTLAMLGLVIWFIGRHRGRATIQIQTLIVASYLNFFPALDYVLSGGVGMESFSYYQSIIILFFQIPHLFVTHHVAVNARLKVVAFRPTLAYLSPVLPWILCALLVGFWLVSLRYELFFRRLGHEGLQRNTAEVPGLLLYFYRCAVETAYFVIAFLWTVVRCVAYQSRHHWLYKSILWAYLVTFVLFFAANSRMQLVLLLLCLICSQPKIADFLLKRIRPWRFVLLLGLLVLGHTLFREIYLENNERIAADNVLELLLITCRLIAARLDSVVILYQLNSFGFDPWGFELSGVKHVINFYVSFFTDLAAYDSIKASLVTSPSVEVINQMLSTPVVDFPKSMILDMFLTFGVLGLITTAILMGTIVGLVQRNLLRFRGFRPAYLVSLYALPMLLEFEKELIGTLFAWLKWTPVLVLLYLLRPRFKRAYDGSNKTGLLPRILVSASGTGI